MGIFDKIKAKIKEERLKNKIYKSRLAFERQKLGRKAAVDRAKHQVRMEYKKASRPRKRGSGFGIGGIGIGFDPTGSGQFFRERPKKKKTKKKKTGRSYSKKRKGRKDVVIRVSI